MALIAFLSLVSESLADQHTNVASLPETNLGQADPKIHITWFHPGSIFLSFDLVRAETDRIFREIAVSATWDKGDSVNGEPDAVDILVILVETVRRIPGVNADVIGYTYTSAATKSRNTPWHTVQIYLPNVLRTMGFSLRHDRASIPLNVRYKMNQPKVRCDLAGALGRIIAHEVVHVVSPEVPHTPHGLMVPVYTRRILIEREMHFPPQYAGLFRANLTTAIAAKTKTLLIADTNR